MPSKANRARVRLRVHVTPDEAEAVRATAAALGLSVNGMLVKVIREIVGATPALLGDDVDALMDAAAQGAAIGRNLNQLVRAANKGKARLTVDQDFLANVSEAVSRIQAEVRALAERQQNRWVNLVGDRGRGTFCSTDRAEGLSSPPKFEVDE